MTTTPTENSYEVVYDAERSVGEFPFKTRVTTNVPYASNAQDAIRFATGILPGSTSRVFAASQTTYTLVSCTMTPGFSPLLATKAPEMTESEGEEIDEILKEE